MPCGVPAFFVSLSVFPRLLLVFLHTVMKRIAFIVWLLAAFAMPSRAIIMQSGPCRAAEGDSLGALLITCTPASEIYQYYGHTALWLQNYTQGLELIYDYGVFDFDSPNFILRFVLGRTDYTVGGSDPGRFFYNWQQRGCTVMADHLMLNQEELHRLAAAVMSDYETEGWTYRYNFFYDNCATRVRDMIEASLDGYIVYSDSVRPQSLRTIVHEHSKGYDWSTFGQDLLLGAKADKGANRSEQQFAPLVLRETLLGAGVMRNGGLDLLIDNTFKTAQGYRDADREAAVEADKAKFPSPMACAYVLLALTVVIIAYELLRRRTLWIYDVVLMAVQGLTGCLVVFMLFFSTHPTVDSNWQALFLNPLPLILMYWVIKGERAGRPSIYHAVAALIYIIVLAGALPQYLSPEIRLIVLSLLLRSLSLNLRALVGRLRHKVVVTAREGGRVTVLIMLLALPGGASARSLPRVVVNITIDGLRSDYLQAFLPLYGEGGFRRLLGEGLVYEEASFPHSRLSRATGVATIQTGTSPSNHGIIDSYWLSRETLQPVFCVDDESDGSSARRLRVSTIGDELKVATGGGAVVYSIAPFRDAAVLGAGHAADGAFWIDNLTGKWAGTSYYSGNPAWLRFINDNYAPANGIDKLKWQPLGDLNANFSYFLSGGLKTPFSYTFKGAKCYDSFLTSGLVNESVAQAVSTCLENSTVGSDETPDYLSVGFYAGTFSTSAAERDVYGEIQDTYVRLDKAIEQVIASLESKVGSDGALVVLTSTGPDDTETSDPALYNIPSGTFYINRTAGLLNLYLGALYGKGQYVEGYYGNELYFNLKLLEQKQLALSDVLSRAEELLLQSDGVKDVYTSTRLLLGAWTPGISKLRNSYCASVSGDVMIQVAPGWKLVDEVGGGEKLVRDSNLGFPIIFWGCNIEAGRVETPVTTDQIAPTIARALRIRAPNACTAQVLQ